MVKLLFTSLWLLCLNQLFAQELSGEAQHELYSPDGRYRFSFCLESQPDGSRQMMYTLRYKGQQIIAPSRLGVIIDNRLFENALGISGGTPDVWGGQLALIGTDSLSVRSSWQPVYGQRNQIREHYNQLTLKFRSGSAPAEGGTDNGYDKRRYYALNLEIRAYDEGVAFRYHFPETDNGLFLHITGEQTQFSMPEGTMAWHESWAQGPYELLPLKDWQMESERPLTLQLKSGLTVVLTEAQMVDYVRGKFALDTDKPATLRLSMYSAADVMPPYNTPWRVVMAAEKPVDLINNSDLILNLNPENRIADASWIKPGKAIRSGLSQAEAIACVDFAAQRGLQYVHLDGGWYGPEVKMGSDATRVAPGKDLDLQALTRYAATKGIGIFVYVNQRALYRQLDTILPLYKKWGIKGIKFGFVQIGNQQWSTWLHQAVKKCAEYGLLVDIHDEYRPTGFSRTYPNLLSQEGIRGNEEMPDATHNTILPFTRFIAGAGDYTICYYNNRIKTTHAHQLALAAIYYSPLQFLYWYDKPTMYQGEPEIEFFDQVKTVWDETIALDGAIGEFVTVARRSGDQWFLGTITNNKARKLNLDFSFLPKGKSYRARIYYDDEKAPTRTKVGVRILTVNSKTILPTTLKPSGGQAIWLQPI